MLNFAGADQRQDDLFMNENFFSRGKSAMKGLKGVENVYTQHTPHIAQTVELLLKGRLRDSSYPYLDPAQQPANPAAVARPQEVILFMIGGTTYEEARTVALLNQQFAAGQNPLNIANGPNTSASAAAAGLNLAHTRIILAGTGVLNSSMWLDLLRDAATRFPATMQSASLSLKPAAAPGNDSAYNLSLGGISLSVAPPNVDLNKIASDQTLNRVGNTLEAGVDAARNVFGRLRERAFQPLT